MSIDFKRFLKAIGIKNSSDMSKQLVMQVADTATTATTTTLVSNQTANRTVTLPDISGIILTDTTSINISQLSGATPDKAIVSNGSGGVTTSATSAVEIGYVAGVTSAIQTQLNNKASVDLSNVVPTADVDMNGQLIVNVADPVSDQDAATKAYVDSVVIGGGANASLSNLTNPTAINQDLIPSGIKAFGQAAARWASAHLDSLSVYNTSNYKSSVTYPNSASADSNFTLPPDNGSSGQVLQTNGSGVTSWVTVSASGANTSLSNLTATAINQDLIFDTGVAATLQTKDDTLATNDLNIKTGNSTTAASGNLVLSTGTTAGTDAPGMVVISTADNSTASPTPDITIQAGDSLTSSPAIGGDIVIKGANVLSASGGTSGTIAISSGDSSSSANSGIVTLKSGDSTTTNSGDVTVSTGTASNASGPLLLNTGTAATSGNIDIKTELSSNYSGNITLLTGVAQTNQSGTITIQTGNAVGGGTALSGDVVLMTGTGVTDRGNVVVNAGGLVLPAHATAPTATTGLAYLDTSDDTFKGYNGTTWVNLSEPSQTSARASRGAGAQSLGAGAPPVLLDFDTVTYDASSTITTGGSWKFTAPSGIPNNTLFVIHTGVNISFAAPGGTVTMGIYKNGVYSTGLAGTPIVTSTYLQSNAVVRLDAGDYIQIYTSNSGGSVASLLLGSFIDITQIS